MDKKTIPIRNLRSDNITQGKSRAPNRSMYYGMGYKETDFGKPMVGVANGHSTITPCNSGLQKLADAAIAGIEEAGGNAQVFGTPTISDGMAMGTEGMKYSLVSREVISDCIETCVQGQWMDGVLVVGVPNTWALPPASSMPAIAASASFCSPLLHGVIVLCPLAMPIIGFAKSDFW